MRISTQRTQRLLLFQEIINLFDGLVKPKEVDPLAELNDVASVQAGADVGTSDSSVKRLKQIIKRADEFGRDIRRDLSGDGFVQVNSQPKYGGIDLNPANLKIEINKENGGLNVEFDPKLLEEIRQQGIRGFIPVIINVQPLKSALPLLSQNADASQMQLTSI